MSDVLSSENRALYIFTWPCHLPKVKLSLISQDALLLTKLEINQYYAMKLYLVFRWFYYRAFFSQCSYYKGDVMTDGSAAHISLKNKTHQE